MIVYRATELSDFLNSFDNGVRWVNEQLDRPKIIAKKQEIL